ncbi:hypothetical protein BDV25DRAFT_149264 [Aspergillus avenaceus]|uniref:Fungal-type protein kinase domain-containing protein n=1 Tax=Aspergillus avenaceus TaxID=36643 RepID=A0A5N6U4I1_ASPAV|nr:hypothetical protein BDV25DRAFT_149264 [Aspergillus avenaceus]
MDDIPGPDYPHIKAVMYSNQEGKEHEILRSELLIILRLMLGQLKKRRFIRHMIAPVLLLSFMGKRGRAIEAYFDGQCLVLRSSQLYNFREQTALAFKDLAELYLGDPVGRTT